MAALSPAAQAVLTACGCPDPDSPLRLVARGFAAAALRALADQAGSAKHWHVNEIRAIAAELES